MDSSPLPKKGTPTFLKQGSLTMSDRIRGREVRDGRDASRAPRG
jgi:hypothetical protein